MPIRRTITNADVPLPTNWKQYIGMTKNKADLSDFLSKQLTSEVKSIDAERELVIASGFDKADAVVSSTNRDIVQLICCHEEADTRGTHDLLSQVGILMC